jgi:hypothetical protein
VEELLQMLLGRQDHHCCRHPLLLLTGVAALL